MTRPTTVTSGARLVHLDDRFAVIDKPAGLSLATSRAEPGAAVERLVAALRFSESKWLDGRELHLVHRLDAPTSGLVVVALDSALHRELASAFARRAVTKVYLAVVFGRPRPRQGVTEQRLGPDRSDRRRMCVDAGGRSASTEWRVVASAPHLSLVALWPRTGRTHQLRVHLAALGHPIVGDDLYGGPRERGIRERRLRAALGGQRALLHAWRLELPALEPARFEAPLPADFCAVLEAASLQVSGLEGLWQPPGPGVPASPVRA